MKEAIYTKKIENDEIQCELCPRYCHIMSGKSGWCKSYLNQDGKLWNQRYGQIVSLALDPIEKKPLFHFFPGSFILSAGFYGCNLSCQFCQNSSLSFGSGQPETVSPEDLCTQAEQAGSIGIAFTYNEPFTMYEYVLDTFRLCRKRNLKTVLVTNGYVNLIPLTALLPIVDAMNIDIKSMLDSFYQKICHGKLAPVLETVKHSTLSCRIEITNLVIPGENDSDENFELLRDFIATINPSIPLHLNRYYPSYHFSVPPTPLRTLLRAKEIVSEKLKFVYIGNVPKGELA